MAIGTCTGAGWFLGFGRALSRAGFGCVHLLRWLRFGPRNRHRKGTVPRTRSSLPSAESLLFVGRNRLPMDATMKQKRTPLTAAERMAAMRERRVGKYRRIDLWLPTSVAARFEDLAQSSGRNLNTVLATWIGDHVDSH